MAKRTVQTEKTSRREGTGKTALSYDAERPIWRFDLLDRDGDFAFTLDRVDHRVVLEKLIEYGNLTWGEIKRQTHDRTNKSKHHYLSGAKRCFGCSYFFR